MTWKINPLGDRVVIVPIEDQIETTLIIPDNAREKPIRGRISAVGPDVKDLGVGETVLFGKYSGTEVPVGRDVVIIMHQTDVMATMEDDL